MTLLRQLALGAPIVGFAALVLLGVCAISLDVGLVLWLPVAPGSVMLAGWVAKRLDRAIDRRSPGIVLEGATLTIPGPSGAVLDTSADFLRSPGWWSARYKTPGDTGIRSAAEGVHLLVAQGGLEVLLHADDGLAKAWESGFHHRFPAKVPERVVRVWAADLVKLHLALGRAGAQV